MYERTESVKINFYAIFYFDFSCTNEIYTLLLQCKNNTNITAMKQELTYENAMKLIAERAGQLAKDPAIQRELLKRHDNGASIADLQKEIINVAIYTLYIPANSNKS